MPRNVSAAAAIPASRIRAIATLADHHPGTLRLFVGEDSLPTPRFIQEAANRAIADNKTFYTPNAGYADVRQTLAAHLAELHGVEVDPSRRLLMTTGGMNAIVLACQVTVRAGDSALVVTPLWPNMAAAIRVTGAAVVEVPLAETPGGFELDCDRLQSAIRPNTRLLAIASPGNPTGWTASAADWDALVAFCDRHDLWLLADMVYERIVFPPWKRVAPSPLRHPLASRRVFVTQSFSKTYRMTGWRIGYLVAPDGLAANLAALQEYAVSHAPGVIQCAAKAAMAEGEGFVAESQARYERHRAIASESLATLEGVAFAEPSGAFYVFPRLDGLSDSMAFCEWLVRERRLGVAPGAAFGEGGEGHVRICFAVEEPILREALGRFADGWREFRERETRE